MTLKELIKEEIEWFGHEDLSKQVKYMLEKCAKATIEAIIVNKYDDSEIVDSVSFPDGHINSADYKRGYRDSIIEFNRKAKEWLG